MVRAALLLPTGMTVAGKIVRCAIYTRKSTEDGLEQEFNSLHAQREACEAYILSQNQIPAGSTELAGDQQVQQQIRISSFKP